MSVEELIDDLDAFIGRNDGMLFTAQQAGIESGYTEIAKRARDEIVRLRGLAADDDEDPVCDRCGQPCCGCYAEQARWLEARLREIREIIQAVDNRAMAVDGPITPTLQEMRQSEIKRIYKLAGGAPRNPGRRL